MRTQHGEPGEGQLASAWAGLRHGRWGVPAVAVVAVLVVVAAVAVALVLRAGTTLPSTDFSSAAEEGGAVASGDVPAVEDGAPGAEGASGGRPPGASASPTSGAGGAAAGSPADGGAGAAGAAGPADAAAPAAPVVVHVVGQVAHPGLVRVPAGSRVADAVEAAGGLTAEADGAAINLARAVLDGEQLLVPRPGEAVVGAPPAAGAPGAAPAAPGAPAGGAPGGLVGLNTATTTELDALPGIGPVLAQRIVDFREANGGFTSVEELAEVTGIGDAVLADVRPLVTV